MTAVISACIFKKKFVDFCVAILILKWKNYATFSRIILCYIKKYKKQLKCKKICAVYEEGAVTDWTCQKWCAKLRAGDFSLDDAPHWRWWHSNRDIENNQRSTMREVADMLKTPKSIKLLMKMKTYLLFYGEKTHTIFSQPNILLGKFGPIYS